MTGPSVLLLESSSDLVNCIISISPICSRRITPLIRTFCERSAFNLGSHSSIASLLKWSIRKVDQDAIDQAGLLHLATSLASNGFEDFQHSCKI